MFLALPAERITAMTQQPRTRQSFSLTFDSQQMSVTFTPYRFSNYGHIEFRSPHMPPRRIPVSETGYRSHFAPMDEIEEAPNLETYAEALARALISQGRKRQDDESQFGLFD
jgi:hypothetical protein